MLVIASLLIGLAIFLKREEANLMAIAERYNWEETARMAKFRPFVNLGWAAVAIIVHCLFFT